MDSTRLGATFVRTPSVSTGSEASLVAPRTLDLRLQKRGLANKPSTKHENLYIPQNDFFYKNSSYLALDPKRRQIRLLRVFPPKTYFDHIQANAHWAPTNKENGRPLQLDNATVTSLSSQFGNFQPNTPLIACEIVDQVPLSSMDGNYCTISYCAGKPTETQAIIVDGLPFNAFATLEHAIRLALTCWMSRNRETELYLWVDQICINQSDYLERSSQVRMMRDIYRRSNQTFISLYTPGVENCLSWVYHDDSQTPEAGPPSVEDRLRLETVEGLKNYIRDITLSKPPLDEAFNHWSAGLLAFMKCPWWGRAWVYQEFIASPRPWFLSGPVSIAWNKLYPLVKFILSELDAVFASILQKLTQIIASEESTRESAIRKKEILKEYLSTLDSDIQLASMGQPGIHGAVGGQGVYELQIHKSGIVAGIPTELSRLEQQYSSGRVDQRTVFANFLSKTRSLHQDMTDPPEPIFSREPEKELEKLNERLTQRQSQKEKIESVRAATLELASSAISSLVKVKMTKQRISDWKIHLQHSRNCDASDPRDRIYAFLSLVDKGYGVIPDYTTENTVVHIAIDTARRIVEFENSLDILEHTCQGRVKLGCYLPSWVPDWTTSLTDCGLKTYASSQTTSQEDQPFDAAKGLTYQAQFRENQANESNVDLKVKGLLICLLDELEEPIQGFEDLRSFLTPDGFHIITPKSALEDDEVWVLHGASMPVLLRPEDDDSYGFIGQALVYKRDGTLSEIMYGQMIELAEEGKAKTRELWLV